MVRVLARLAVLGAFATAVSCNNGGPNPTAPSGTAAVSIPNPASSTSSPQTVSRPVRLVGAVSNLSGTCPTVTFTVSSTTVATSASTTFSEAGCVAIVNGGDVVVVGTSQSEGSVMASHVDVVPAPGQPPAHVQGTVSNLSGTCPTLTFTVGSTTVATTATTTFGMGGCQAVVNGATVVAVGPAGSAGSLTAERVFVLPATAAPPTHLRGMVSNVSGTCPVVTFIVGTTTVETSASTTFGVGGCQAIADGATAVVDGATQSDGSVAAARVFIPPSPPTPPARAQGQGQVTALSGACPTVTFTVNGTSVSTTTATVFDGGSCSTLADGNEVSVSGVAQTNGSIVATVVARLPTGDRQ